MDAEETLRRYLTDTQGYTRRPPSGLAILCRDVRHYTGAIFRAAADSFREVVQTGVFDIGAL